TCHIDTLFPTRRSSDLPYHLHFEIHPVSLLYLDYDGAVDPTSYLLAWQHLHDVAFSAASGWVPPAHVTDPAPKPGAVLLQVSDRSEEHTSELQSLRHLV